MSSKSHQLRATAVSRTILDGIAWPSLVSTLALISTVAMTFVSPHSHSRDTVFAMIVLVFLRIMYVASTFASFIPSSTFVRDRAANEVRTARNRDEPGWLDLLTIFVFDAVFPIVGYACAIAYAGDDSHSTLERVMPAASMCLVMMAKSLYQLLSSRVYAVVDEYMECSAPAPAPELA